MEKRQLSTKQKLSRIVRGIYTSYLRLKGCDIGKNSFVARDAHIDFANPKGIHIGDYSRVSVRATINAHDYFRGNGNVDTYIGHHSVIAGQAFVCPGIKIGNHVFVAACSVVTKDVPDHCLVAGNPAKIIKEGIEMNDYYQIVNPGHRVEHNNSK